MAKVVAWRAPQGWQVRWLVFLLLLAQLLVTASYVLRPVNTNRSSYMGFYATQDALDVVCIGASSMYSYWAPMSAWAEYGIASYNLANASAMPEAMLPMLKEVLQYQTPTLIVVDLRRFYTTSQTRTEVQIRNTTDSMRYTWRRTQLIASLVPTHLAAGEDSTLAYYLFDIAKYHDNWKTLTIENFAASTNIVENRLKGFRLMYEADATLENFADYAQNTTATPPDDDTLALFTEFLDYASGIEAEVLFVVTPYDETQEAREVYNYYQQLILACGMGYLNANDFRAEMGIADAAANFYDGLHVNIYGAEKYTTFLGEYITAHYTLPDRRTDAAYASAWGQDYTLWVQDVQAVKAYLAEALA